MPGEFRSDSQVGQIVGLALMEDIGLGDITTDSVVSDKQTGRGKLLCKEEGIVAGLDVAAFVFRSCDDDVTIAPLVADGCEGIGENPQMEVAAKADAAIEKGMAGPGLLAYIVSSNIRAARAS